MTEKRYMIEEIGNMFRVLKDNEPLTTKFENTDKQDVINLIGELNELHEQKMIVEEQLESATNEIDKLLTEINTLTDTCHDCCAEIRKENKQLKDTIKTSSEVINDYAKQFKRHSKEFSFMCDLAEDLRVDVKILEASDD